MKRAIIIIASVVVVLAGLTASGQIVPPSKKIDQVRKIDVVKPESVTLNRNEIWVFVGPELMNPAREGYRLAATVLPANATSKKVVWESSDPGVATVDAEGHVRPVKVGSAVIRATTVANKLAAECRVTVEVMNRPSGSTAGDLLNRGYMARQGSWLYFADPGRGMRLSKMKIDGSAKALLGNDQAASINVSGGTVTYINNSDGRKLYSVDIYGQNRRWLNDSNPAFGAQTYGDEIMYGSPDPNNRINLYRMKADGTGRRIIDWPGLGNLGFFHRVGGSVFYSLGRRDGTGETVMSRILYRPLEGGAPAVEAFGATFKSFTVETANLSGSYVPGRIFYISEAGEVRAIENFADGKKRKDSLVARPQPPAKGLSAHRGWVYYYNSAAVSKVRWDGRENQALARIPAGSEVLIYPVSFGSADDDTWIYYYVLQPGAAPKLFRVRSNGLEMSALAAATD